MRNYSLNNGDPVTQFGPIDVQVVAFPGSNFTGAIAPALRKVVEKGTINIVDLAFITKTADGVVEILELSDLSFKEQDGKHRASAIAGSDGHVVLSERIPREIVQAAVAALNS